MLTDFACYEQLTCPYIYWFRDPNQVQIQKHTKTMDHICALYTSLLTSLGNINVGNYTPSTVIYSSRDGFNQIWFFFCAISIRYIYNWICISWNAPTHSHGRAGYYVEFVALHSRHFPPTAYGTFVKSYPTLHWINMIEFIPILIDKHACLCEDHRRCWSINSNSKSEALIVLLNA